MPTYRTRRPQLRTSAVALIAFLGLAGQALAQSEAALPVACGELVPIPLVAGNPWLRSASVVNEHGLVGGYNNNGVAVLWDSNTGQRTFVGTLVPGYEGSSTPLVYSYVEGLNDHGEVVGSSIKADASYGRFYWSVATGILEIEGADSANAINNRGQVVGNARFGTDSLPHPFISTRQEDLADLGLLPGCEQGIAVDINDFGVVTGTMSCRDDATPPQYETRAFVWYPFFGLRDIGSLGGMETSASTIDDLGRVWGRARDADGVVHLFRWHPLTGISDLGEYGERFGVAGSSESGAVVGGLDGRAIVYTAPWGIRDLAIRELVGGPVLFSGASDINRRGLIVGSYAPSSRWSVGFVWRPCRKQP